MSNNIPSRTSPLVDKGGLYVEALKSLETSIGVKQNTAQAVGGDLDAYVKAEHAFQASRTRRSELMPQRKRLEKEVATFLDSGKHVLKKQFGAHWSPPMSEAGFVIAGSVATPKDLSERATLLERMAGYFEAHPQLEVPVLGVSAKAGKNLHQKLNAVRTALADQQRDERNLAAEREEKAKALRLRLQGLVNELHQLLKPEDPRWHAFGIVPRSIQRRKTAEENRRKREAANTMREAAAESNLVALSQQAA